MRKFFLGLIFLACVLTHVNAQETPPAGLKQLTTNTPYINPADSSLWEYKGITYGYSRKAKYSDIARVLANETLQAIAVRGNSFNGTIITNNTTAGNNGFYRAIYFGTSITRGFGSSFGDSTYVNRSAKAFGVFQDNRGVDGSEVSSLFNSVTVPYDNKSLKYVFLQYETNEFYHQTDTTAFKVAYAAAIDSLTSLRGIPRSKIVMIGAPYLTVTGTIPITIYMAIAKKIAVAKGVKYVEMYNYMLTHGGSSLIADGLHPNNAGHRVMADNLVATFPTLVYTTNKGLHADSIVSATNINTNFIYSRSISADTVRSQVTRATIQIDSLSVDPLSINKRKLLTFYDGRTDVTFTGIGRVTNAGLGIFSQNLTQGGFGGWWVGYTPQTATSANATFFVDGNANLNINRLGGSLKFTAAGANTFLHFYDNGAGQETGIGYITTGAGLAIYANGGAGGIYAGNGITRTTASATTAAWYIGNDNRFVVVPGRLKGSLDWGGGASAGQYIAMYNGGSTSQFTGFSMIASGAKMVQSVNVGGGEILFVVGKTNVDATEANSAGYMSNANKFFFNGGVGYNGSTSGTTTVIAPAIAGTTTITLPGVTSTLATLAGTETLSNKTFSDNLTALNFYSISTTPTITPGPAAGTGATASIVGNNQDGIITINVVGTSTTGVVATITMSGGFSYPNKCIPIVIAEASAPQHLDAQSQRIETSGTATTWSIVVLGPTGITATGTYKFNYHNGGY